jgi:hypothetical protein
MTRTEQPRRWNLGRGVEYLAVTSKTSQYLDAPGSRQASSK